MKCTKKLLLLWILLIFMLSGCSKKYNSDDYIGKTSAEIIEEYGKFDYESVLKDKVGYKIVTRRNKDSFLH